MRGIDEKTNACESSSTALGHDLAAAPGSAQLLARGAAVCKIVVFIYHYFCWRYSAKYSAWVEQIHIYIYIYK